MWGRVSPTPLHHPISHLDIKGSQRNVAYLGRPIASSFMSQNGGERGGGVAESQPMSTAVHKMHMEPKLIWRSNSIFNLWFTYMIRRRYRLFSSCATVYILNDVIYSWVRKLVFAYMSQSLVCHRSGNISFYSVHTPQGHMTARPWKEIMNIVTSFLYLWMRSSRVTRAYGCQCLSSNRPGFDPSILRINGILEAAGEAVLNKLNKKTQNPPVKKKIYLL